MTYNATTDTTVKLCTFYHMKFQSITSPPNEFVINQIITSVVNGVVILLTILLNSVAIRTISKCSQLKNKLCYFLVLVQSVTDLLVGIIVLPLLAFALASNAKGKYNIHVI